MKPIARFALIGVAVAGVVALASALYLRKSHEAVQRVVKAVELSAPDLFPADTLLYTEMTGWDQSFARAEAWWKKFEGTAAWLALQRGWKKDKLGLPPELVANLENVDKELDRAQQKFGYRPTTRHFFETYGKHVAIGLLPAPKGQRPRLLLATRLPDDGMQSLQGHLSKAGGVKACDPPLHKGFPLFQEEAAGVEATVFYGVGRGYLFVSDALPDLKLALERLALATDGTAPKKPEGTLAGDPVLARVRPAAGKGETGLLFLRRDQKFAEWEPDLAPVDEFIRNAFVLAPKDEAVAFSLPDGPDGKLRCSFQAEAPRAWTKSLPPGLIYLQASAAAAPRGPGAADFFNKPLWKEIDAFVSDPKQVKAFLTEALPADARPDDELVGRFQNDARFLGAWARTWIESALGVSGPQYAYAMKIFPGLDGAVSTQQAFGIDLDPATIFLIAGGLDFGRSRASEWLIREERPGVLIWSLDMKRAMQELRETMPPDALEMVESWYGALGPSLIVAGGRVVFCLGTEFAKEIAAILSGGPGSFEEDPIFVEARAMVRPGYTHVSWDRPAERVKAGYGAMLTWIEAMLEKAGPDDETLEYVHAGVKTVTRAVGWAKSSRAILGTSYPDAARPSEGVELIDAEAEKGIPTLVPGDAAVRSTGLLPADTWLYLMQRLELKPSYDALRSAFAEALPGGEERMKSMFPKDNADLNEISDAVLEGLLRNVKGEVGLAIARPHPKESDQPPGPAMLLARVPAFVAFAEFERPADAFKAVQALAEKLQAAINETPFRERLQARGEGEAMPFGTELKVGMTGESKALALDIFIPMEPEYLVVSLCVIERAGFLFVTNSPEVLRRLGEAKEKDADSLAARLGKSLPAGTAPEKVSAMTLYHGDTLVAQVRLLLEPLTKVAVGLTLQGYEEGPPPDRMQAHQDGWARWMDLVLDLFKSNAWSVGTTARTGSTNRSARVVVPERKD